MQGSGTFAVESMISSLTPKNAKILILINGAYGERIQQICKHHKIKHHKIKHPKNKFHNGLVPVTLQYQYFLLKLQYHGLFLSSLL